MNKIRRRMLPGGLVNHPVLRPVHRKPGALIRAGTALSIAFDLFHWLPFGYTLLDMARPIMNAL